MFLLSNYGMQSSEPSGEDRNITVRQWFLNGPKWQEMHNMHSIYNTTIVDLCFDRHGVLLNGKLNHIDVVYCSITHHIHLKISQ